MKLQETENKIKNFEKRQATVSILALFAFIGISFIANSLHLRLVAEQSTRFVSRLAQLGELREMTLILAETQKNSFTSIQFISKDAEHSFSLPPNLKWERQTSSWAQVSTESVSYPVHDSLSENDDERIEFTFSRFQLLPHAFILWLILNLVSIPQTRSLKRKMVHQFTLDLEREKNVVRGELVRDIRHNLRTPLAALMRIPSRLPVAARNEKDLLSSTIQQIHGLLSKLDDGDDAKGLSAILEENIYDTLLAARQELFAVCPQKVNLDFHIDDQIVSAKVPHIPTELRSIFANLFNNSLEAIPHRGRISFHVFEELERIVIKVSDSGQGVPADIQDRIFDKNFSFGKKTGTGIGLTHAQQWLERWNGRIKLQKSDCTGTEFKITLPIADRAPWYAPRIKLTVQSHIVVLDDQLVGREVWRHKLQDEGFIGKVDFFASAADFIEANIQPHENLVLLFDFDLGKDTTTGHDLLIKFPDVSERFLVTGHFDQRQIRDACEQFNIQLLPKSAIADLPIVFV